MKLWGRFNRGVGIILILAVMGVAGYEIWLGVKENKGILSPLADKFHQVNRKSDYKVVGFLPTWMVDKANVDPKVINELVFLGIEIDEKGEMIWDGQSNRINSQTYSEMKKEMKASGGKNIVGIKLFEDDKIKKLLASDEAKNNLISQIKAEVASGGYDGVNIDFEYQGDPLAVLEDQFVALVKQIKQAEVGEVGVDVMANTIIKGSEEEDKNLVDTVDEMIVMVYDFNRPGQDFAGPVAPIGSPAGKRNVMEVIRAIVGTGIDKKKIIMAYPLYGYEYKTKTDDLAAETIGGWGTMASYSRVMTLINNYGVGDTTLKENFDEESMTPWLSFTARETAYKRVKVGKKWKTVPYTISVIHQIYYDDLRSLEIKLNLAKESNLGGVGFWALGYEGDDPSVWDLVNKTFSNPPVGGQVSN